MPRHPRRERAVLIPAWAGAALAVALLVVQLADARGVADPAGWVVSALAVGGAATSVRWPLPSAALAVAATLMNAAFPGNAIIALYGLLLWMPVVVGAIMGPRSLVVVVLAQVAATAALEYQASPFDDVALAIRIAILVMLFVGPGLAGLLLGRYWTISRDVTTEMQRDNELFRRALSRDLHDTAVHATTSMVMRANQALLRADLDDQARRDFQFIADTGRDATRTLRRTLAELRETEPLPEAPSVDATWFRARLNGETARLEEAGFTVRATTEVPLTDVPADVLATVGRIVTEVVNNVLRHGKPASEVTLMLENSGATLTLMCTNVRGPGEEEEVRTRLGVVGMTELAQAQGGSVTAKAVGPHWVTHVSLPTSGTLRT